MEALSQVADDLFELVIDIDPARTTWQRLSQQTSQRARQLAQQMEALKAQLLAAPVEASLARALEAHLAAATHWLGELSEAIQQHKSDQRWRALYVALAKSYDDIVRAAIAARLGELHRFRRLSPANHSRSFFHVLSGVIAAGCYHYLLDRQSALILMGIFVVTFTGLELLRRSSVRANDAMMRFPLIRRIARAREYYEINSSTYYGWGVLLAVFFCSQEAVEAGCLALAFGDPMASYVGRRLGRVKLFRDKSVIGTLVFFGTAFLAISAFQLLAYPGVSLGHRLGVAALAALVGAAAEVFTFKLDDNFSVPLFAALAVTLAF